MSEGGDEDADEALLEGLILGQDDGLGWAMMSESGDNGKRYRSSSSGSASVSKKSGIVPVAEVMILVGIILWLLFLVVR